MLPILGVAKELDKKKQAIIKLYHFIKGNTDIFDQRMTTYSTKPKSSKWIICTFSYMLDVARVNASTVTLLINGLSRKPYAIDSFKFIWEFLMLWLDRHCVKSFYIRNFSGPYFPAFGLNTPYLSVLIRMQENMDQKNSECGHFYAVHNFNTV